jgi:hypothetical protein
MSCGWARRRFSAHRDGELPLVEAGRLALHLEACAECGRRWHELNESLDVLAEAPRLEPVDTIASRVFDRLDIEGRQPGLASLFRSFRAARPLMLPSLVPAVVVLVAILSGALALDRFHEEPLPVVRMQGLAEAWEAGLPPSGTESNPLFPSSDVSAPRIRSGEPYPRYLLDHPGEGTMFFETVVARDGSVSAINLLEGDLELARPVLEALRHDRYEPGRLRGRPVAVSMYRLISRIEVKPIT